MLRKRQIRKAGRCTATLLWLTTAFCLFALTVLQGITFCLCVPDPDACGEACHECTSVPDTEHAGFEHLCEHLDLAALPPGKETPDGLQELLSVLLCLVNTPHFDQMSHPVPLLPYRRERPPDVLYPQLLFIARSAQILC